MTPSTAIQRPDLGIALLEFDLAMSRQGFIAQKVFPVIDVALATANFSRVKIKNLLSNAKTDRAPGAAYSRNSGEFEQDNYATKEQGHEEVIDDNEAKMYAYTIDSDLIAAMRAQDVVLRNYEKRVAAAVFNTSTWTGSSLTLPVTDSGLGSGVAWSNPSTAIPITNVKKGIAKFYANWGFRPNTGIITWTDFLNLQECSQIIDRIKYSGRDDPKNITAQSIAAIFELEQILVADAVYNSANEGQNLSLSPVWTPGNFMLARTAKSNDVREACIGRTFHWVGDGSAIGGAVEEYREERVRGSIIRVRHQTDEKVINKEAGFLITGI